jgi:hypothetical protein
VCGTLLALLVAICALTQRSLLDLWRDVVAAAAAAVQQESERAGRRQRLADAERKIAAAQNIDDLFETAAAQGPRPPPAAPPADSGGVQTTASGGVAVECPRRTTVDVASRSATSDLVVPPPLQPAAPGSVEAVSCGPFSRRATRSRSRSRNTLMQHAHATRSPNARRQRALA